MSTLAEPVEATVFLARRRVPFDDTVQITYNDLARKDPAQQKQQDLQDVAAGIMQVYEYRMKWYGEDEETARAHVPVRETGGFVV